MVIHPSSNSCRFGRVVILLALLCSVLLPFVRAQEKLPPFDDLECVDDTICDDVLDEVAIHANGSKSHHLYNCTMPGLYYSSLIYKFVMLLDQIRAGNLNIDDKTREALGDKRLRNQFMPASVWDVLLHIDKNEDAIRDLIKDAAKNEKDFQKKDDGLRFDHYMLDELIKIVSVDPHQQIYVEDFDSLFQDKECVYGIVRDGIGKRIFLVFRGSVGNGTEDWKRNFEVDMTYMHIPRKLPRILAKEQHCSFRDFPSQVLVHSGFYEYLFNNTHSSRETQKFDIIRYKLFKLVKKYPGYKIVVVGHSLGGALATLVAFKLSGSKKTWIPRPIQCFTFESPMVGGQEFQDAFVSLERLGMLQHIRVTNQEDFVPAIPPLSWNWRFDLRNKARTYKHVGVHLNLFPNDIKFDFPRKEEGGVQRALRNNFVTKRWWNIDEYHGLKLVHDRLTMHVGDLEKHLIKDLYEDKNIVGNLMEKPTLTCKKT